MRSYSVVISFVLLLAAPAFSQDVNGTHLQEKPIDAPSQPNEAPALDVVAVVTEDPNGNQVIAVPSVQIVIPMTTPAPAIPPTTGAPEIPVTTGAPEIPVTTLAPEEVLSTTPESAENPTILERIRTRLVEIRKVFQERGFSGLARYILSLDAATRRAMLRADPSMFSVKDLEIINLVRALTLLQKH